MSQYSLMGERGGVHNERDRQLNRRLKAAGLWNNPLATEADRRAVRWMTLAECRIHGRERGFLPWTDPDTKGANE